MNVAKVHQPLVSVIMPVYNAERFVGDALKSILNQTYTKFESIIIDDGSKDESLAIIKKYADPRIRLIALAQNQGIVHALNTGLKAAQGKYIARMDADDVSMPSRLAMQVAFMEKHPEVGLLGTQHMAIQGRARLFPTNHHVLVWYMLNACPFVHPSVMLRVDVLKQHQLQYDKAFEFAEDLELWTRMCRVTQVANLPQSLIKYRYHFATHQRNKETAALLNTAIKKEHIKWLCPTVSGDDLERLAVYLNHHLNHDYSITWFDEMFAFYNRMHTIGQEMELVLNRSIWFHLASCPKLGVKMINKTNQFNWIKLKFYARLWLIIKNIS
jgi:glycosyltransferase involved in cell wall biosynthesis